MLIVLSVVGTIIMRKVSDRPPQLQRHDDLLTALRFLRITVSGSDVHRIFPRSSLRHVEPNVDIVRDLR